LSVPNAEEFKYTPTKAALLNQPPKKLEGSAPRALFRSLMSKNTCIWSNRFQKHLCSYNTVFPWEVSSMQFCPSGHDRVH